MPQKAHRPGLQIPSRRGASGGAAAMRAWRRLKAQAPLRLGEAWPLLATALVFLIGDVWGCVGSGASI